MEKTKKTKVSVLKKTKKTNPETKTVMLGKKGKGRSYSKDFIKKNMVNAGSITVKVPVAKKEQPITIDKSKVHKFLKSLNGAEIQYTFHLVRLSSVLRDIIRNFNLSREYVCKELEIPLSEYKNYVCGAKNYDLHDLSKIDVLYSKLKAEEANKSEITKKGM